jgi:FAD/FMN-containing dehydrogenase/Fe-S oxidoreductase
LATRAHPRAPARRIGRDGELAAALRRELRGEVRMDDYTRHLFAADASLYAREPLVVAFPRDGDDVAAAIAQAAALGIPVVLRGAGTSLAGQSSGLGLVLDTSRHMDAIGEIDAQARRVRVGPGVVQEDLNRAAARHGLAFGPDTSTANRATLGGMIGNNSSGSQSIVYGCTIDHVHALDVVLADGTRASFGEGPARLRDGLADIAARHRRAIEDDYPPHWRRAGGYRLDRLQEGLARFVVGSEGTLVAVTEAEVGLVERPANVLFGVGLFDSLAGAIAATDKALALDAAAIELMDRTILDLSRRKLEFRALADTLPGDPDALLFVTFFGDDAHDRLDKLERAWSGNYAFLRAQTAAEQTRLMNVRKAGLGLLMAASEGPKRPQAFVEDTAVAPERLGEYVERFQAILARHDLIAGFYGHCSVGCLHVRPYLDVTRPGGVETLRAVAEEVVALVAEFDGVNSSEHGDGLVRSEFNRLVFGDELYEAFREVKRLFDPQGIMNPGVMVDAAPLETSLRDAALPAARPLRTTLHFPGGMREAADRCQRIGACRKTGAGVMCPSYMATREEEHATRGRANALVRALSQPDPAAALGDERLHEILDLCLECKACKSECPLSVDMASLKSEFLSHYQAEHGVPLRSRAFAAIRTLNRLGSATAPVSNLLARAAPLLGIAKQRPLPRFDRHTLKWNPPTRDRRAGDVVFLADSFTTYTDPDVGRAAIELLEAAGHRVRLESRGCCGRSSISKGLLDGARKQAEAMVARLAPEAERGVPIVGVEPSCLLTLTEEYLQLLAGDPRAQAVAKQVRLAEELLLDADLPLRAGPERILFHGHCHQKALAGTAATVALLRRIPGAEVVELDAGCCGMAGSFGFEAEHYDLSMRIGESRLFPAVRSEPPTSIVAATGVSCRQQIAHGTGREARHPLQVVRAALEPGEV